MSYWQRIIRTIGIVTALLFVLLSLTPVSNIAGQAFVVAPVVEPAGAIVVTAAGILRGGDLVAESMRRTMKGIDLYKKALAPLIVMSGSGRGGQSQLNEAEVRARLAESAGIPRVTILIQDTANTTREEAVLIAALLKERKVSRILLVTESLHMRRTKMVFEREGLQVLPVPSDDYSNGVRSPDDRMWLIMRLAMESTALVYYRLAGYL